MFTKNENDSEVEKRRMLSFNNICASQFIDLSMQKLNFCYVVAHKFQHGKSLMTLG
jgi:hypothetical protein